METNNLTSCEKCGIVLDYTISLEKKDKGYAQPNDWKGNCPVCKGEIYIFG